MKTLRHLSLIVALVIFVLNLPAGAQSVVEQLKEARRKEIAGDIDAAVEIYQQLIEEPEISDRALAKVYYNLGKCYLKKGDEKEASEMFDYLVENFPEQKVSVSKARRELKKIERRSSAKSKRDKTSRYSRRAAKFRRGKTKKFKLTASMRELAHHRKKTSIISFSASGHAVRFEASDKQYWLKAIRIRGAYKMLPTARTKRTRTGRKKSKPKDYESDWELDGALASIEEPTGDFHVYLCDENLKEIADFTFPCSLFPIGSAKWIALETEPTKLPPTFIICVDFGGASSDFEAQISADTTRRYRSLNRVVATGNADEHNSFIAQPNGSLDHPLPFNWLISAIVDESGPSDTGDSTWMQPDENENVLTKPVRIKGTPKAVKGISANVALVSVTKTKTIDGFVIPHESYILLGIELKWDRNNWPIKYEIPVLQSVSDDQNNNLVIMSAPRFSGYIEGSERKILLKTRAKMPAENAAKLKNIKGYVEVTVASGTKLVTLNNTNELAGKSSTGNPVLDKLNFKIISIDGTDLQIEIDGGRKRIKSIVIIKPDDMPAKPYGGSGTENQWTYRFKEDLSKMNYLQCWVEVIVSEKKQQVPFAIDEIEL